MQVKQNAVVARNVRSHSELDTGFHQLRRRFTTIVNHTDRHLVAHEHLSFGIVEGRNLRTGEHFGRSVTHDVRNSNLQVVVQQASRNSSRCRTHSRRSTAVGQRMDSCASTGIARVATLRSRHRSRSQGSGTHSCGPVHTEFASAFAVHNNELCGNHDLEGFHVKFGQSLFHLFDLAIGIVHDNGVRTFHGRNTTTVRLHAFKHFHQFFGLGMVNLEILTDKRSILFSLGFFIGNLLLLCLVSGRALDQDVLVFDNPGQVVHATNDVEGFLPSLLGHLEARLTLDFRGKDNVNTGNHGDRAKHGFEVHVDETEVIQFLVGGLHRTFGRSTPCSRETHHQEKNSKDFCHLFHF